MLENFQNKKYYKADEIANVLGVKKFVIRTWEKQFDIRRTEAQYTEDDLKIFEVIRDLLYGQKLSPTEAKQQLASRLIKIATQTKAVESEENQTSKIETVPVTTKEIIEPEKVSLVSEKDTEAEIVGATLSSEKIDAEQVQPAFKQNEEFWNNLKLFKEQLLKIQEQLK